MPDPTPPPPPPAKPKRTRAAVNQGWVAELTLASQLCDVASQTAYATTARDQLDAKVVEIADLRREIQYAADAQWPAGATGNAGIRREFQIPPTKALA